MSENVVKNTFFISGLFIVSAIVTYYGFAIRGEVENMNKTDPGTGLKIECKNKQRITTVALVIGVTGLLTGLACFGMIIDAAKGGDKTRMLETFNPKVLVWITFVLSGIILGCSISIMILKEGDDSHDCVIPNLDHQALVMFIVSLVLFLGTLFSLIMLWKDDPRQGRPIQYIPERQANLPQRIAVSESLGSDSGSFRPPLSQSEDEKLATQFIAAKTRYDEPRKRSLLGFTEPEVDYKNRRLAAEKDMTKITKRLKQLEQLQDVEFKRKLREAGGSDFSAPTPQFSVPPRPAQFSAPPRPTRPARPTHQTHVELSKPILDNKRSAKRVGIAY